MKKQKLNYSRLAGALRKAGFDTAINEGVVTVYNCPDASQPEAEICSVASVLDTYEWAVKQKHIESFEEKVD